MGWVIQAIDQEIQRLQQVRSLLADNLGSASSTGKRVERRGGRRKITAEGRARIAEAQHRRWAAQKNGKK